jgi:hypothetical protein
MLEKSEFVGMIRTGVFLILGSALPLTAQQWDLGGRLAETVSAQSEGKLKLAFEQRVRYEVRDGNAFGKDPDLFTGLARTRLSLSYSPRKWLKFSGMVQDARSPWYGNNAPATARDSADLHEAYVELFGNKKTGFGMSAGRMMLNYGESRLIGSPQWGNVSRSYDHARIWYATKRARVELLAVSPVKVRLDEFNTPVLGDRIVGLYNSFPDLWKKNLLDVYLLRRTQNRPGGFTAGNRVAGTDHQNVNTLGFRLAGPLSKTTRYSIEGAAQNGKVGPAGHRGLAWFTNVTRRRMVAGKALDLFAEYKFASGARNPKDTSLSRTFDQLYASNHDKFGHQDLFGWRNIHNLRGGAVYAMTKSLALNWLFVDSWLASRFDSLYNGSGKALARSAAGTAGRHVGQEFDFFGVYKYKRFQLGAGYGYLRTGGFLRATTPGVSPSYLYVFHTYSL